MELEETAQRLRRKANRGKKGMISHCGVWAGWWCCSQNSPWWHCPSILGEENHRVGSMHWSENPLWVHQCQDFYMEPPGTKCPEDKWPHNSFKKSREGQSVKTPGLWCHLCAQFHYYFSSLHSQTLLFTPTYKPPGRWETLSIIQNLISFPMQQDKNHIKLQEKGRENKINPHNPTSSATHRICIPTFPSQPVRSVFCRFPLSSLSLCTATACLAGWDWSRQVWKNHRGLNIIRLTLKAQELTGLRKQLPIFPPWGCSDLGRERENP